MLTWSAVGVAVLVAGVIALALAPRVALLVIVAVGILALVIRLAMRIRLRGSLAGHRDTTGEDLERGKAMQTFQRDQGSLRRPRALRIPPAPCTATGRSAATGPVRCGRGRRPRVIGTAAPDRPAMCSVSAKATL